MAIESVTYHDRCVRAMNTVLDMVMVMVLRANGEAPASQNVDMRGLQRAPSLMNDTKPAAFGKAVTPLQETLISSSCLRHGNDS